MTNSKFISSEPDLTYDDVLINPTISTITSRFGEDLNPFYIDGKLPIVSSPMDSIFSKKFADASKDKLYVVFSHRFQTHETQIQNLIDGANGAVIGLQTSTTEIMEMIKYGAKHILLDVANGGNIAVIEKLNSIQWVRDNASLWAGNVANKETYFHIRELCDYVRVGIGGGSACKTRTTTGVGKSSLSSILDCSQFYSEGMAKIVADGGIKTNGHICIALAAGAHLVMLGSMFAACEESCAEIEFGNNILYKKYRGMASREVNEEAGKTNYSVEGGAGLIPMTGSVSTLLSDIEANLRSSMSYVNARNLEEFQRFSKFVIISQNTVVENGTIFK
jgi:IMP dehydrogenase